MVLVAHRGGKTVAEDRPKLGLVLHSNLARRYAAHGRDHPLGVAADRIMDNYTSASAMQQEHWGAVLNHLSERGNYG